MASPELDQLSIGAMAAVLGVSASYLRKFADAGDIPVVLTEGGHRRFVRGETVKAWEQLRLRRGLAPDITLSRPREGADEAAIWDELAPRLSLPARAEAIAQYVTTEMVNNAIDHSNGTQITVVVEQSVSEIRFRVIDDGEGVFAHLAAGLSLHEPIEALGELTKGKRTTDPDRHTGEGIFFSSKAADLFTVEANGLRLTFDNERKDFAYGQSSVAVGTTVSYTISRDTERSIKDVFDAYTDEEFRFARTVPRIKLFEIGVRFVSRSEAKRLAVGLEKFSEVELDFAGVTDVGQGFADELLRVWATAHPDTKLIPTGMNDAVAFMVRRARP